MDAALCAALGHRCSRRRSSDATRQRMRAISATTQIDDGDNFRTKGASCCRIKEKGASGDRSAGLSRGKLWTRFVDPAKRRRDSGSNRLCDARSGQGRAVSLLVAALALATAPPNHSPRTHPPVTAPVESSGAINSQGQRGGVTAGSIGAVTQVLPSLVRGPLLVRFKAEFTRGARLRSMLLNAESDEQAKSTLQNVSDWANGVYAWLDKDADSYAAERFAFTSVQAATLTGPTKLSTDVREQQSSMYLRMTAWLENLDMLMRDPGIYPDK